MKPRSTSLWDGSQEPERERKTKYRKVAGRLPPSIAFQAVKRPLDERGFAIVRSLLAFVVDQPIRGGSVAEEPRQQLPVELACAHSCAPSPSSGPQAA